VFELVNESDSTIKYLALNRYQNDAGRPLAVKVVRFRDVPPGSTGAFADLGITQDSDAAWLKRRFTPHPLKTYETPLMVRNPIGNGLPRTYIACTNPVFGPANPSKAWVRQQAGWDWIDIPAGHLAMVTAPDLLAQTLATIGLT